MVFSDINLFDIELNSETDTFTPGETVKGIVRISTTTILKCSKITLIALGRAHIIFSIIPDEIYFNYQSIAMVNINRRAFSRNESVDLSVTITNEQPSTVKYVETGILTIAQVATSSFFGGHEFDVFTCKSHFFKKRVNIESGNFSYYNRSIPLFRCLPTITKSNLFRVRHFVYVKIKNGFFSPPLIITTQILIFDNLVNKEIELPSFDQIYPSVPSSVYSSGGNSLAAIANGPSTDESDETRHLID
uniref:Arrestin-like N-terminal domain-containing protein n=1 Tax=Panagrolaimus sp. PS1159 TaxID=55785 RepID=A0AC35FNE6_9BILA